jgi:colicin/pyocin-S2-like DNase family protein
LRGTAGNAARLPKEIADHLRGGRFATFEEFGKCFWQTVAQSEHLSSRFSASNRALMAAGNSPKVALTQQVGKHIAYEIHHLDPISEGGGVYNMGNLLVATPRFHGVYVWALAFEAD